MTSHRMRALLPLLGVFALLACTSDGDPPEASSTAEAASPTAAATLPSTRPTPAATTRAPFILQTPTPFPTPEAMSPNRIVETNARRTGVPEIDRVIDALFGSDQAALDALIRTQSTICHEEPLGVGDMDVCPEGVEEGTLVEYFRAGSCHGYPSHERPYVAIIDAARFALFAIVHLPNRETGSEVLIVILGPSGRPYNGFGFYVESGQLVGRVGGCQTIPDLLARGGESPEYLLPPFALPE